MAVAGKRGGARKNAGRKKSLRPIARTKAVWLYRDQIGKLTQTEVRKAVDEYIHSRERVNKKNLRPFRQEVGGRVFEGFATVYKDHVLIVSCDEMTQDGVYVRLFEPYAVGEENTQVREAIVSALSR